MGMRQTARKRSPAMLRLPLAGLLGSLVLSGMMSAPVAAHADQEALSWGAYLAHIDVWDVELAPGEQEAQTLAFGDGVPLSEGWFMVLVADVQGSVRISLEDDGTLGAWEWNTGHHEAAVRLDHDGYPTLRVENTGTANATVRVYYDQTCDCLGKSIRLPQGAVVFPVQSTPEGPAAWDIALQFVPVRAGFETPDGTWDRPYQVRIEQLEVDANGTATVLEDQVHDFAIEDGCDIGRPSACITTKAAAGPDRVLRVEVLHDRPDWAIQVRPLYTPSEDVPALGLLGVLVLLFALLVAGCAKR